MNRVNCVLCNGRENVLLWKGGRFKSSISNVVCVRCGLVYINSKRNLPELEKYYKKEYREKYVGSDIPTGSIIKKRDITAQDRVDWVMKNARLEDERGKVLDVGCSSGNFLKAMVIEGWDPYGVDMTIGFTEYARNVYGLKNVMTSSFEKSGLKNNFFDLITMFHVLEHVYNPEEFLNLANKKIKEKGLIIIEVPDVRLPYSGDLNFFFQDAHLYNFSEDTLEAFLIKTGFKLKKKEHQGDFLRVIAVKDSEVNKSMFDKKFDNYQEIINVLKQFRRDYILNFPLIKIKQSLHLLKNYLRV